MELDKYLRYGHEKIYEPEGDVLKAQELISWANHLVFVYPTWWGGLPAVLRLFFEMVLVFNNVLSRKVAVNIIGWVPWGRSRGGGGRWWSGQKSS